MGIIEDHEARLGVLEMARHGVHSEITNKIDGFAATLEGQSRRLTAMEANHAGIQKSELDGMGRRVARVEEALVKIQGDQDTQDLNFSGLLGEIAKDYEDHNDLHAALIIRLDNVSKQAHASTLRLSEVLLRLMVAEEYITKHRAWDALPWWKRWWRRIRGKRP